MRLHFSSGDRTNSAAEQSLRIADGLVSQAKELQLRKQEDIGRHRVHLQSTPSFRDAHSLVFDV